MSLRSSFSNTIRSFLRSSGREVVPYSPRFIPDLQRRDLIHRHNINLVLDIGANTGQTGEELRSENYTGNIISFEPQSAPYKELKAKADADPAGKWRTIHSALGETEGSLEINISGFSASSSLLPMMDRHVSMLPDSAYVGKETVAITRLDKVFPTLVKGGEKILMKIDTQGYEMSALRGTEQSLPAIELIYVEVSFVPLYDGQAKYYDVMKYLDDRSFDLAGILPAFYEKSRGRFLQADLIFVNRNIGA